MELEAFQHDLRLPESLGESRYFDLFLKMLPRRLRIKVGHDQSDKKKHPCEFVLGTFIVKSWNQYLSLFYK